METTKINGDTFFVDDLTKELSKKYDATSYKGPMNTQIKEANTEAALGKLLFISRMVGEFVGVDFQIYKKRFPNENYYDDPMSVNSGDDLEIYARLAQEEGIEGPLLRIEYFDDKKIYFPTENLIKVMLKGISAIPS